MPKLKTHKGTAKRIKLTGSGKLARERAYGNHILAKKSKARKRNIKTAAFVNGKIARTNTRARYQDLSASREERMVASRYLRAWMRSITADAFG